MAWHTITFDRKRSDAERRTKQAETRWGVMRNALRITPTWRKATRETFKFKPRQGR